MAGLRRSRPSGSWATGCGRLGPASRSARICAFGSYGARTSASSATANVTRRTTDPTTTRWFESRRTTSDRRRCATGDAAARGSLRANSAIPDPWVCDGVEDVGDEIADDDRDRAEDRHRQDHRVIPREHGIHREAAHARQREHVLDDHRAADEQRQDEAHDGDDRKQRVPESVAQHDDALAESLRARGADVILTERLE